MTTIRIRRSFDAFRMAVRPLLRAGVPPETLYWDDGTSPGLFGTVDRETPPASPDAAVPVPRAFVALARVVAQHRDPDRWNLLYRVAFRLTRGGERGLMDVASDPDVARLLAMERAVRRDRHKMTAFVRFRRVTDPDGRERYVAWHRPEHYVVPLVVDHFVSRFGGAMRFAILTPDESLLWDGERAAFGGGVSGRAGDRPRDDELEPLWLTYYASTFNPSRIKLRQMRKEMPVRHWPTLPETALIPRLLAEAPARMSRMVLQAREDHRRREAAGIAASAEAFLPPGRDLASLRSSASGCRGCGLCASATQTVFGEGPTDARAVFVGEQPGDEEDRAGRPFVGPAGRVLDELLRAAGIDRADVYLTNAVKHFKFTPRGKRRLHVTPSAREVAACRPWVEAELAAIKPAVVVCLGVTAARALLGPEIRLTVDRGRPRRSRWCDWTIVTLHPAALLRMPPGPGREAAWTACVGDLRLVARRLATGASLAVDQPPGRV